MQYVLFSVSSLGYLQQSVDALVEGIAEAIRRAHESIEPGDIYLRLDIKFISNDHNYFYHHVPPLLDFCFIFISIPLPLLYIKRGSIWLNKGSHKKNLKFLTEMSVKGGGACLVH